MINYEDGRLLSEHVKQYKYPTISKVATVGSIAEYGIVRRRDIVLPRRGKLNGNANEVIDTVSITH